MTKQIEQAVAKYAEAAKWEQKCRVAYEAALFANVNGDQVSEAREAEAYSVCAEAEADKDDALKVLTNLLVEG